jgi:serine/threonine-protein kinase
MPAEPGHQLSQYRLVEKIGEGGMGVVYRAHDERLDRIVALKVLPTGSLEPPASQKRLRKEAFALSRLNHPNIETVHDFGSEGGIDFLVMEYIPGTSLDERLFQGVLPEREILSLGAQLAAGLAAAHAEGVVHRDLKPSNLRITTDGRLKILDFGLAKWLCGPAELATTAHLVGSEGGAGTLPYMAPEQLRKEGIDLRSDIYAMGAVLYEMATGQRPFTQTSPPRLIEAILNETPTSPSLLNATISSGLEAIIVKALDKNPGRRYQAAREIQIDLERLGTGAAVSAPRRSRAHHRGAAIRIIAVAASVALLAGSNPGNLRGRVLTWAFPRQIRSIAVLPLVNFTGNPQQEYFVDGMTDELITSLAQVGSLRVISRTSIMQYKGTHKKLGDIARDLGVQAVVEGGVWRAGDRVLITAQLIDASSDRHLWADSFERDTKDILFLQGDLAQSIAGTIRTVLTPEEKSRLTRARSIDPDAYDAYLRARSHSAKFTATDMSNAVGYLQEAVARQPDYALAYAEMARDYWYLGQPLGDMPYREAMEKARAAATKAMGLDKNLGEAYSALGTIRLWYDWNPIEAEKLFKRAIELTPGDAFTHFQYGFLLVATGRAEAAIAEGRRAVETSPLELTIRVALDEILLMARRYDESIQECRKMVALDPTFPRAYDELSWNYEMMGRYDLAAAARADAQTADGEPERGQVLRRAYAVSGKDGYLRMLLSQQREGAKPGWQRMNVVITLTQLGETDEAFALLEDLYSQRQGDMVFLGVGAWWDPLRSDPRFQDLVRRIGIRPL